MPRKKSATSRKRTSKATRSIPSENAAEQLPQDIASTDNEESVVSEETMESAIAEDIAESALDEEASEAAIAEDAIEAEVLEAQEAAELSGETVTTQDNELDEDEIEISEAVTPEVNTPEISTSEPVKTVDAVVDRRSPETDNPRPIHPMDAMSAQREEPEVLTNAIGEEPVTLEAQVEAVPTQVDAVPAQSVQVQTTPAKTVLSGPVVDELNVAIAAAHRHEEELESHIMAIQEHEDQLKQQVIDAQSKSTTLTKTLEAAETREDLLKQEIADLKQELDQARTKAMQLQAQVNDQDKNQRELLKLKGEVAILKTELDDAKRYILQLTESQSTSQSLPQSTTSQSTQSSTVFPPPLSQVPSSPRRVPHTRVVGSPRRSSRPITPASSSSMPQSAGLPPMSTDQFSRTASQDDAASRLPERSATQRSPQTLRPAYTRPGFSNTRLNAPSKPVPQPMPPLESLSHSQNSAPSTPPANPPSAIVPQRSTLARRRSRYDELKPELKSSDLPQPKVSDAEIGWFD